MKRSLKHKLSIRSKQVVSSHAQGSSEIANDRCTACKVWPPKWRSLVHYAIIMFYGYTMPAGAKTYRTFASILCLFGRSWCFEILQKHLKSTRIYR